MDLEIDMAVKTTTAVCEHSELYHMTLYTTRLSCEHRHGVVKFSNMSGLPQLIQCREDGYSGRG